MHELKVIGYPYIFALAYLPGVMILDLFTVASLEFQVEGRGTVKIDVDSVTVSHEKDKNITNVRVLGTLDEKTVELRLSVEVESIPDPSSKRDRKDYKFSKGMLFIH